jgi:hypothetical protein
MMGTRGPTDPPPRSALPLLQDKAVRTMMGALGAVAASAARTLASIRPHRGDPVSDRRIEWPGCEDSFVVSSGSASRQVEARLPSHFSGHAG